MSETKFYYIFTTVPKKAKSRDKNQERKELPHMETSPENDKLRKRREAETKKVYRATNCSFKVIL